MREGIAHSLMAKAIPFFVFMGELTPCAPLCPIRFAKVGEATTLALGTLSCTGVAAMKNEPMMGIGNLIFLEIFGEYLLYAERRGTGIRYKTQAVTDAEDVRIDCHTRLTPDDTQHHVGCLAAYAWQSRQLLHVLRHFASVLFLQLTRHLHKVLGLVVRV